MSDRCVGRVEKFQTDDNSVRNPTFFMLSAFLRSSSRLTPRFNLLRTMSAEVTTIGASSGYRELELTRRTAPFRDHIQQASTAAASEQPVIGPMQQSMRSKVAFIDAISTLYGSPF